MVNFKIDFLHSPWWLLLLIPAIILTLIPYFKLSKRYRKTRNRITSIVLHSLIMLFCICVLSGMVFRYQLPNPKNEILLLVDVSDTEESAQQKRDEFIQNVLLDCEGGGFQVGVVTFGYDQEYAVPLTSKLSEVYEKYLDADLPDTSATNIADALSYVKDLFQYPQTAKILLITDGKETDKEAADVIRSIAAQGTKLDTAYVGASSEGTDIQVLGIDFPDYHVNVDEECEIGVTISSNSIVPITVRISLQDTALFGSTSDNVQIDQLVDLTEGEKTIFFKHRFLTDDLHEVTINVEATDDILQQNNVYSSYMYLQTFKNILIIERTEGESVALEALLNNDKADSEKYEITTLHYQSDEIPLTVDGFRKYEQVILNNISNPELKSIVNPTTNESLDVVLEEYVSEYGGGLFTVGGMNENNESNVYNQDTMYGSLYQQMLPVESIKYTPPVGIMLIVDVSGSMMGSDPDSPINLAILGALACLDPEVLSERDYVGIMTLDSVYGKILQLTPMTQRALIKQKIEELADIKGGATYFSQAIESAAQELNQFDLAKRHIVVVTDGGIAGGDWDATVDVVKQYHEANDITLSVIGIGIQKTGGLSSAYDQMSELVGYGEGNLYTVSSKDTSGAVMAMRNDFRMQPIEAINDKEPFFPVISKATSPLVQGIAKGEANDKNRMTVQLGGYFGVKVKEAAELILTAEYGAPIYAQWKYGKGMVGSFMCDLQGEWSADFMSDPNGILFIDKVVKNLMPLEALQPSEIRVELTEDNYTNSLRVYTNLQEGEYVKGELIALNEQNEELQRISLNEITQGTTAELREMSCYVTSNLAAKNNYSRAEFIVKQSGVYKLVFTKYNAEDEAISTTVEIHKAFAYSEEYQKYDKTEEELIASLSELATNGGGKKIEKLEDPWELFDGFVTAIDKSFDPRYLFIILAIVLFLLDIAVRKFKFKWLHEIIRKRKAHHIEKGKK